MNDSVIIQSKQPDEKFCSDCGGIIKLKAEICPKCGVRQLPAFSSLEISTPENKKLGEKFLLSTGISFLVFLIIVLSTTPQDSWTNGIIGTFMFALFSGAISMAIPTTRKIIYLPVSLSVMLLVAMLIGLSMK